MATYYFFWRIFFICRSIFSYFQNCVTLIHKISRYPERKDFILYLNKHSEHACIFSLLVAHILTILVCVNMLQIKTIFIAYMIIYVETFITNYIV